MYRRIEKPLLLLAILASLSFLLPPAAADSRARIVRVSYVEGNVQLDQREGQGYNRAMMNMPVTQGTRLWARGDDALAEVEFEDGSTIRLEPKTSVEFQELGLRSSGQRVTSVELSDGAAYFDLKGKNDDFRVTFGGQQISVERSTRFRLRVSMAEVQLAVYKGEVEVRSGAGTLQVRKDESFSMDLTDPGRYHLAKGVEEDPYSEWNKERESYRETYTSTGYSAYPAWSSSYSPYYSYGWSDLNYFGQYMNVSGYGWMWRPYYVSAGWDPFMDGAWMSYPGLGYMWVSSYPWGWLPYRYGTWIFVAGRGWCWQPGNVWNTWTSVPVMRNAPSGWVRPTPPPPGSKTTVVVGRGLNTVVPPGERIPGWRSPRLEQDEGRVLKPGARTTTTERIVISPPTQTVVPVPAGAASSAGSGVTVAPATTLPAGSKTAGEGRPLRQRGQDMETDMRGKSTGTPSSAPAPAVAPAARPAAPATTAPRQPAAPSSAPNTSKPAPSAHSSPPSTPRAQFSSGSSGGRAWGGAASSGGGKSSGSATAASGRSKAN